jgi:Methylase involved in ubiquinone/menaquinone biosynthesis
MASTFINPGLILQQQLQLRRDMIAADFGCGSGEWALALAKILDHGKVWAVDLLEDRYRRQKAAPKSRDCKTLNSSKATLKN